MTGASGRVLLSPYQRKSKNKRWHLSQPPEFYYYEAHRYGIKISQQKFKNSINVGLQILVQLKINRYLQNELQHHSVRAEPRSSPALALARRNNFLKDCSGLIKSSQP